MDLAISPMNNMMQEDPVQRMMSFPLFDGYTEQGIRMLMNEGKLQKVAEGHLVFCEGDPSCEVVLLLEGCLDVSVYANDERLSLPSVQPGTVVGEISLLCGTPRAASVRAVQAATLLVWQGDAFSRLLYVDAGFARRIYRQSLSALIEAQQKAARTQRRIRT